MKSNQCSNVGTIHVALSGSSSGNEVPAPGDYRTGRPEGGIMPEVSWTSDTRVGCVSGLVDLFRTTFVFEINSSGYFSSTRQIIGLTVRRGDGSMFGMLEGCGGDMGIVSVFAVSFSTTLMYNLFSFY